MQTHTQAPARSKSRLLALGTCEHGRFSPHPSRRRLRIRMNRSAAQLSKLRAALVRAGRQAVAVVTTSELGAVPALRLLQTWLHTR
eukprot:6202419-Pleurochrysis_carterae.AAC.3